MFWSLEFVENYDWILVLRMLLDDENASRYQYDWSLEIDKQWGFELLVMHDFELELPLSIRNQVPDR
jgi:hypothetical protein